MRALRYLSSSLLCSFVLASPRAQEAVPQPAPAARVAATPEFDWFDTLGHRSLRDLPIVCVSTPWKWSQGEESGRLLGHGYLIEQLPGKVRLVTIDLLEAELPIGLDDAGDELPVRRLTPAELVAVFAADEERGLMTDAAFEPPYLSHGARLFVLARKCAADGDAATAQQLLQRVATHRARDGVSLQQDLAAELGHVGWWRVVLAFGDAAVSRADLAARTERLLQQFPALDQVDDARAKLAMLHRMSEEHAAHPPVADLAALSPAERIAELVFRLRDQNGAQYGQPGACDVFADPRREASPAHRLLAEGFAAVPALAAAMDDVRLSRSVGYHRDFYFSHQVLTVGDVAQQVLQRMTGQWFADRAAAEQFAATLRDGGEAAARVQSVIEQGSVGAAERLLEIAPGQLLDAVRKLLAGPLTDGQKAGPLRVVGGLDGDDVVALLREQAQRGGPRSRLSACLTLCVRDGELRRGGLEALGALWTDLGDELRGVTQTVHNGWQFDLHDVVGEWLAMFGGESAMAALAARPGAIGHETLVALGGTAWPLRAWLPGRRIDDLPSADLLQRSAADERAREDLLGSLLGDRTVLIGGYNDARDPRRCDFAAASLARRWPQRYTFDLAAEPARRDVLLVAVRAAFAGRPR